MHYSPPLCHGRLPCHSLIAILLGRLRLNVDECISAYQRLCGQIFVKESYPLSFVGKLKGRFSTPNLERFLKEVVGEHINGRSAEHELFNSENDAESQLCKVYVASLPCWLASFLMVQVCLRNKT